MNPQTTLDWSDTPNAAHSTAPHQTSLASRIASQNWQTLEAQLGDDGYAVLPQLLTPTQCRDMAHCFANDALFRSRIVMERYAFGRGVYQYFHYPLPPLVAELRETLYGHLAPIANRWHTAMRLPAQFPPTHADYLRICHAAGQLRPTPLLLRYQAGGRLHLLAPGLVWRAGVSVASGGLAGPARPGF